LLWSIVDIVATRSTAGLAIDKLADYFVDLSLNALGATGRA
jgi:hypothetical protein